MILSAHELNSLLELKCKNPHQYLGMHPLGKRKGVVARAFLPGAQSVHIIPLHPDKRPSFELIRIGDTEVFEGTTLKTSEVYAYDLKIMFQGGGVFQSRDAYSFLPTCEESALHLHREGKELRLYEKLGGRLLTVDGVKGVSFSVWAPNAAGVSVVGDFNGWDGRRHLMRLLGDYGVWEIFVPGVGVGARYKYEVRDATGNTRLKVDPFGRSFAPYPYNDSIVVADSKWHWTDEDWLQTRQHRQSLNSAISIYEVHLGSWMRGDDGRLLSYEDLSQRLVPYVQEMGFTHVEILPIAEHAYYPSWGYQVTGFYGVTSRYGSPEGFRVLVNECHRAGIGVIMDWVPAHFPRDDWALAKFDGTALYEHEDPRQGAHQDWGTLIFNFGRNEVRNFLIANALYWCDQFHIDGLRVDAVASMLYLDYSRKEGEWIPNRYGGRENLEAVEFLREFNHHVHTSFPGVLTVAEESTAWPMVSRPPYLGGLGFSLKWNMGWMHDTLGYFGREPIFRKYHQNDLTFAMLYHHQENFVLALSHDEVVHGKRSLRGRMPGNEWEVFANLRLLFGYQWCFPGKKLVFMGGELGQWREWDANSGLRWLESGGNSMAAGLRLWVRNLNELYRREEALYGLDYDPKGFSWIDCSDTENSVLAFVRTGRESKKQVVVILNLTPVIRQKYRVGVTCGGAWEELLNSDAQFYGGSGVGNLGIVHAEDQPYHGRRYSLSLTLPPLSILVLSNLEL